ncbi:MAG TPA: hypothetical protein VIT65_11220 [Microlunatus sp.]
MSGPLAAQDAPRSVGLTALLLAVGCRDDELDAVADILRMDYGNPADLQDCAAQARAAVARHRIDPHGPAVVDSPPFDPDR